MKRLFLILAIVLLVGTANAGPISVPRAPVMARPVISRPATAVKPAVIKPPTSARIVPTKPVIAPVYKPVKTGFYYNNVHYPNWMWWWYTFYLSDKERDARDRSKERSWR